MLKEISDLKQEQSLWQDLCSLEQDIEVNIELCLEKDKDLFLELENTMIFKSSNFNPSIKF